MDNSNHERWIIMFCSLSLKNITSTYIICNSLNLSSCSSVYHLKLEPAITSYSILKIISRQISFLAHFSGHMKLCKIHRHINRCVTYQIMIGSNNIVVRIQISYALMTFVLHIEHNQDLQKKIVFPQYSRVTRSFHSRHWRLHFRTWIKAFIFIKKGFVKYYSKYRIS